MIKVHGKKQMSEPISKKKGENFAPKRLVRNDSIKPSVEEIGRVWSSTFFMVRHATCDSCPSSKKYQKRFLLMGDQKERMG